MRRVDHHLRVGDVVDGRDHAVLDADPLVEDFDNWRQAIGGTGRGGPQTVRRRVVQVIIDAHDDVQRTGLDRRCYDHGFYAGTEVFVELFGRSELPTAFQYDVDAGLGPRDLARHRDGRERHRTPIDHEGIIAGVDGPIPSTMD